MDLYEQVSLHLLDDPSISRDYFVGDMPTAYLKTTQPDDDWTLLSYEPSYETPESASKGRSVSSTRPVNDDEAVGRETTLSPDVRQTDKDATTSRTEESASQTDPKDIVERAAANVARLVLQRNDGDEDGNEPVRAKGDETDRSKENGDETKRNEPDRDEAIRLLERRLDAMQTTLDKMQSCLSMLVLRTQRIVDGGDATLSRIDDLRRRVISEDERDLNKNIRRKVPTSFKATHLSTAVSGLL